MTKRSLSVAGVLIIGLFVAGCGSSSSSQTASTASSASGTAAATTTAPATTTTPAVATAASCPTLAQANAALGVSNTRMIHTSVRGGGAVCEYMGAGGVAGLAIYAHQSAPVFAGLVAHAPGAPAMPAISGVGDGAFGQTNGGVSIVNAYSNANRTFVAAQVHGGSLSSAEALAKVALADN